MRTGQMVAHRTTSEIIPTELANLMVGRLFGIEKQPARQ